MTTARSWLLNPLHDKPIGGRGEEIAPVPAGLARPLWSVMIPVFNSAQELRRSLASVLAQAASAEHMQIQVVDDCSTRDDPEAVVKELGGDRVEFYRQPVNRGHSKNFNTCLRHSRGHIVHILHSDDWVGNGFYDQIARLFESHPQVGAAFCRHAVVDPAGAIQRMSALEREDGGVLEGWLDQIAAELRLQPPSIAAKRSVYEHLGGFDTRLVSCGEDWEMWVRIAADYPVAFEPALLAFYQDSPDSLTKRSIRNGQNIRDVRRATRITRQYLTGSARSANSQASINWAKWALHWAYELCKLGDYRSATVQVKEALLCSLSREILRHAAHIAAYGIRRAIYHPQAGPDVG